jgi:hypothetical protein
VSWLCIRELDPPSRRVSELAVEAAPASIEAHQSFSSAVVQRPQRRCDRAGRPQRPAQRSLVRIVSNDPWSESSESSPTTLGQNRPLVSIAESSPTTLGQYRPQRPLVSIARAGARQEARPADGQDRGADRGVEATRRAVTRRAVTRRASCGSGSELPAWRATLYSSLIRCQPCMPKRMSRSAKAQITSRLPLSCSRSRASSWRTSVDAPPSLTIEVSGRPSS